MNTEKPTWPCRACEQLRDLAKLIQRMRAAQKAYFRTRGADALADSKAVEREVDDAIKAILSPPQQESLL